MIKIRQGVFETNSSSMHSIALRNYKPKMNGPDYWRDFYIKRDALDMWWSFDDLLFGRGFDILFEPSTRLAYAIASLATRYKPDYSIDEKASQEAADSIVQQLKIPGVNRIILPTDWNDEICFGSVDHQSYGVLKNFLEDAGKTLYEFVYDDNILVIIDGDERPHRVVYPEHVALFERTIDD